MKESIQHIGKALKKARETKSLSQRELSQKTGIPQSHISKIENGTIDLQISSLIELSRMLDLEPMLVPRELVVNVIGLMRKRKGDEQIPAFRLDDEEEDESV